MSRRGRSRRGRGARGGLRGGLHRPIARAMKRVRSGCKFTPAADPSTVVNSPWNNVVIVGMTSIPATGVQWIAVSPKTLANTLVVQAGLYHSGAETDPVPVEMRFQRVSAWNMSGGGVSLQPYDLQDFSSSRWQESIVSDMPGKNHWARVGYAWSAADASAVYASTSTSEIFKLYASHSNNILIHVQAVWRSSQTTVPHEAVPVLKLNPVGVVDDPVVTSLNNLSDRLRECIIEIP